MLFVLEKSTGTQYQDHQRYVTVRVGPWFDGAVGEINWYSNLDRHGLSRTMRRECVGFWVDYAVCEFNWYAVPGLSKTVSSNSLA